MASRRHWRECGLAFVLALYWLTSFPSVASAQDARGSKVSTFERRYDGFRYLFEQQKHVASSMADFAKTGPEDWKDWIVVCIDDDSPIERLGMNPFQFLRAGGSILLATDRQANTLRNSLGVLVVPGPVSVAPGRDALNGNTLCPIIRDWPANLPLFKGISSIAFNHSGTIRFRRRMIDFAVEFPRSATVNDFSLDATDAAMVGCTLDSGGRLLVIADQSLFVNLMLLRNDNLFFARNTVEWLSRQKTGKHVLFFESGEAVTQWVDPRFANGTLPDSDIEITEDMINKLIAGVESEQLLDKIIDAAQDHWILWQVVQFIGVGLTLILLLYVGRSIIHSRQTPPPAPPQEIWPSWATLGRRRNSQMADGNYGIAARQLSRWFFSQANGEMEWNGRTPKLRLNRSGFAAWRIRRQLKKLWGLATADVPRRMEQRSFQKLVRRIGDLSRALAAGTTTDAPLKSTG